MTCAVCATIPELGHHLFPYQHTLISAQLDMSPGSSSASVFPLEVLESIIDEVPRASIKPSEEHESELSKDQQRSQLPPLNRSVHYQNYVQ